MLSGHIEVAEDDLEAVKRELPNHIELTRNEDGCLAFQVLQDAERPTRFSVYEEFSDQDAFDRHQARVRASTWGEVTVRVQRHYQITHVLDGSCLCGAVRYQINGPLASVRYCHCSNCRKFSGTSPATWAMAASADLHCDSPRTSIGRFNSGRGVRCFCKSCGSPLWFESIEHPDIVGIPLGTLEGENLPAPEMHLWMKSKPSWCVVDDVLPKLDAGP